MDSDHLVFGHRRLSIIDLSPESNQPFHSTDGRYVILYNGQLYNYRELKAELKDVPFRTVSDTEVVLAAYARWGAACLDRFKGMFAFALWDREMKEVFIARDRLGIKPLYFWQGEGRLLFASELRALLATDLVPGKLDHEALGDYLRYQTVHSPATLVKDVRMLMPGHWMRVKDDRTEIRCWWDPVSKADRTAGSDIHLEHCPHCGGPLKIIAAIVDSTVIARILVCLFSMIFIYCCLDVVGR